MRLANFSVGTQIKFDERLYRLAFRTPEGVWQAIDCETSRLIEWPVSEIEAAYAAGHLTIQQHGQSGREREASAVSVPDLSDGQQAKVRFCVQVLQQIAERTGGLPVSRAVLQETLAEISTALGRDKPVSVATYYRWAARAADGGALALADGRDSPKGRRASGAKIAKQVMADAIVAAKQVSKTGHTPTITMNRLQAAVRLEVADENMRRSIAGDLRVKITAPSRSTLHRIWKEFPAEERAIAERGRIAAAHMFRGGHGGVRPEACLDLVEFDETRAPFYFFDEGLGVPLGRAWLSWYIDVYSHAPVGFYLGFEPPGDLGITSALRHACLPKAYVATQYPNIKGRLAPAGVPRRVTFDNGLAQWGKTIETISLDLNMTIQFARPRTPWFKSRVEGMFRLLNEKLLQEMPGFVLRRDTDKKDYDPSVQGCIGLRHFLYIFHSWLVDNYMQKPQGMLLQTPAELWDEGTAVWPPDLVPRAHDLDILFGIKRSGRLDHRGVVFENLRYHSPELHALRRRYGDSLTVEVKVDPADLGQVHARIDHSTPWIRATATAASYAQGLSLHRHKLNLKNAREKFGGASVDDLIRADALLRETIADALPAAESIRTNQQIARALGVGTENLFGRLDHDGQLNALRGPYKGMQLNPFLSPPEPCAPPLPLRQASKAATKRTIPNFDADHSLGNARDRR